MLEDTQHNKADGAKSNPSLLYDDLGEQLEVVRAVLDYGAQKYEPRGWQTVNPIRYRNAMLRHDRDFFVSGDHTDFESGLHHLAHDICNRLFYLWFVMQENPDMDYTRFNKPPRDHRLDGQ